MIEPVHCGSDSILKVRVFWDTLYILQSIPACLSDRPNTWSKVTVLLMSDQRKGKCSWAQCVNTSVVINLELTCHTWDLSGKLSKIIDATASADPFFPISKLVNVVLFRNVTWAKPLSYVIFFEGKINCFRVIFVSLMVLASQGHSLPGIVLLQHISMHCDIQIEKIQTISINTISRVKHIR